MSLNVTVSIFCFLSISAWSSFKNSHTIHTLHCIHALRTDLNSMSMYIQILKRRSLTAKLPLFYVPKGFLLGVDTTLHSRSPYCVMVFPPKVTLLNASTTHTILGETNNAYARKGGKARTRWVFEGKPKLQYSAFAGSSNESKYQQQH